MSNCVEFYNGKRMPKVGLGTSQMGEAPLFESIIDKALQLGYRHFDTAYQYQNERHLGNVVKKWIDSGRIRREELFIVTKLPLIGMNPTRVEHFLKLSLNALQLDYVDLYLVHWPIAFECISNDDIVPMKDGHVLLDKTSNLELIWEAMERQCVSGLAKSIGISNFTVSQIERIMKVAKIPPATNQVEMHLYFQQTNLRETCTKHNISLTAYGPLGSPGRQNHQYFEGGFQSPTILKDPIVLQIAKKLGNTPAQVVPRFLTQMDVCVIPKASSPERLLENLRSLEFDIAGEDLEQLKKLDQGERGRAFTAFPGTEEHPDCPFPTRRQQPKTN